MCCFGATVVRTVASSTVTPASRRDVSSPGALVPASCAPLLISVSCSVGLPVSRDGVINSVGRAPSSELMGTIGRVVTRCSSLLGQTGVNVGRFLGLLLSGTLARFVCHRFFLLVTAGACVLRCRSLRYPCTFCFCADCHYDRLRGFWLQRWVGGLLYFS